MKEAREILNRIHRKWTKFHLHPIHVFCFHQVSETFDASTMYPGDWTQIEQFKRNILQLKKRYTFISLEEAYRKLNHDKMRFDEFAVLTADDGWASLKNILPWLNKQQIPVTLFVNPAYLSGEEIREKGMSDLLMWDDLNNLVCNYSNITIASHGWNHTLLKDMDIVAFQKSVMGSHRFLMHNEHYIPFYAYPCGQYSKKSEDILNGQSIVPVYMDGKMNYFYDGGIHRELLDGLCL